MKTYFYLFVFAWMFSFNSCCINKGERENCHRIIYFNNFSDKGLHVLNEFKYHRDSLYIFYSSAPTDWTKINPYENLNKRVLIGGRPTDCWEGIISSDTLQVFILDEEKLQKEGFDKDKYDIIVLQRYDLSLDDIKRLEWVLSYPPTEEMKDVKMYPPYKKE